MFKFTYLPLVVGGNAAHVVVDGGQNWDGLAGDVDACEDHRGLGNAGKTSRELLWRQVVQLQVDVILFGSAAATLSDLDGHRAGHDVAGGQVLGDGGVTLHEPLAFGVEEVAAFTAAALGDETASTVNSWRIILNLLHQLR